MSDEAEVLEIESFEFKVNMTLQLADGSEVEASYSPESIEAHGESEARSIFLDQFNRMTLSDILSEAERLELSISGGQADTPDLADLGLEDASVIAFSALANGQRNQQFTIEFAEIG